MPGVPCKTVLYYCKFTIEMEIELVSSKAGSCSCARLRISSGRSGSGLPCTLPCLKHLDDLHTQAILISSIIPPNLRTYHEIECGEPRTCGRFGCAGCWCFQYICQFGYPGLKLCFAPNIKIDYKAGEEHVGLQYWSAKSLHPCFLG
jgi:hypothetical protein